MLKTDQINEIHRLAGGEHWSIRRIARQLHMDTRTVKKYLDSPVPAPIRRPRPSKLDPFKPLLAELLQQDPHAPGVVILQRLEAAGYSGGHTIFRDYLKSVRGSGSAPRAFVRMEPGRLHAHEGARSGTGPSHRLEIIAEDGMAARIAGRFQTLQDDDAGGVWVLLEQFGKEGLKRIELARARAADRCGHRRVEILLDGAGVHMELASNAADRPVFASGQPVNFVDLVRLQHGRVYTPGAATSPEGCCWQAGGGKSPGEPDA